MTTTHQRPSEKLKKHLYLLKCSIELGGFSREDRITFPCYDSNGRLGVDYFVCHPMHLDKENQLCRADLISKEGDKAKVYLNGETFTVPLDSLVKNS